MLVVLIFQGSSGYTLRGVSVEFVCQSNSDPYFYVDQYTKIGNTYIYPFSLYGNETYLRKKTLKRFFSGRGRVGNETIFVS